MAKTSSETNSASASGGSEEGSLRHSAASWSTADATPQVLTTPHGQLSYVLAGDGEEYVVLFHGFGQEAKSWLPLVEQFGGQYTFVLVDLFYHGHSRWEEKSEPVTYTDWSEIMQALVEVVGMQSFVVGGFSIGCKFALATVMALPHRVKQLILVAPDGLVPRFWYNLATGTTLTINWFKQLVFRPGLFFKLVGALSSLKVIDRGTYSFVTNSMNTRQKRLQVFHAWVSFRKLHFNPGRVAQLLNDHQIPLWVYLGKWDRLIRRKHVSPLLGKVKQAEVMVLEAAHHNLVQKVTQHVAQTLAQRAQSQRAGNVSIPFAV